MHHPPPRITASLPVMLVAFFSLTFILPHPLQAAPDFFAHSPSFSPTEMRAEYGKLVQFTVTNSGDAAQFPSPLGLRFVAVKPGSAPQVLGYNTIDANHVPTFQTYNNLNNPIAGASALVQLYIFVPEGVFGTHEIQVIVDPENGFAESNETNNTLVLSPSVNLLRVPDLSTGHIPNMPPRVLDAGEQFDVTTRILNIAGLVDLPPFLVDFYLVPPESVTGATPIGYFIPSEGIFIGRRQTPAFTIGQQANPGYIDLTATFGLPLGLDHESYRIGVVLDAEDQIPEDRNGFTRTPYREVTNARTHDGSDIVVVTYVRDRPDYAPLPSETSFAPTTTPAGEFVTFSGRVRNLTAFPGEQLTTIYHSLSAISGPSVERYLGTTFMPPIAANSFYDFDVSLRVPANLPPGEYRYKFTSDAAELIPERDELNNGTFTTPPNTITVTPSVLPNLTSSTSSAGFAPTTVQAGSPLSVSIPITNSGQSATGAFDVRIALSTDVVAGDADDITIHTYPFPGGIAAGATVNIATSLPLPAATNLPPGTYRLAWRIDVANTVEEFDEADNNGIVLSPLLTVAPDPGNRADLIPSVLQINSPVVQPKEDYDLKLTIANDGATNAPASEVAVYLTDTTNFDPANAFELFGAQINPVTLGSTVVVNLTGQMPGGAGLPSGTYYFAIIADAGSVIDEVNETNNTVVFVNAPINVRPAEENHWPQLSILNASANPSSLPPGTTFSHLVTITNSGETDAAGVVTRVVLSSDDVLGNGDDVILKNHGPEVLMRGQTTSYLRDLRLPDRSIAPNGSYSLFWVVDPDGLVPEIDTSNNSFKTTIDIRSQPATLTLYNANPDSLLIALENTESKFTYKIEYTYTLGKWFDTGVSVEGDPDSPIVIQMPPVSYPEPQVDSLFLRAVATPP